jgi:hypothetical protein
LSLACHVAHQTEGRTRLRVLEMPPEAESFSGAARRIAELAGVEAVRPRITTGSLVILHPALSGQALLDALAEAGVELAERPQAVARPALVPLRERLDRADTLVREASQGSADLHTLGFLALGGLAVMQMMRGQTLGNASSFLWYAFHMLNSPPRGGS